MSVLIINICCEPSSEPSQGDGSDEGSQHMVSVRNKTNYPSTIIKYSSSIELSRLSVVCKQELFSKIVLGLLYVQTFFFNHQQVKGSTANNQLKN